MDLLMLANGGEGEMLPETFHFLNLGWWVLHVLAIPALFLIGYLVGRKGAAKRAAGEGEPSGV
jgi:hypothetical protein